MFSQILEDDILHFAKNELQTFCKILCQDFSESSESQMDPHEDKNEKGIIKKAFLKITLDFMRNMKQEELAHALLNSKMIVIHILIIVFVCVFLLQHTSP